jgi:precorrin-2 dehydrogenase/sirohydrochlorin ferrochelatase
LANRSVLVVGGGKVGLRKARKLFEAGAKVLIVDPQPRPVDLQSDIEWKQEAFKVEHLAGVELAFASATVEVNRIVVDACRELGLWVNSASEPERGDFILPATARVDDIQIAVSTGGRSPTRAIEVRNKLVEAIRK